MLGEGSSAELLIRHAHVLDPATGLDGIKDIRLFSGRIAEVGQGLRGLRELDAELQTLMTSLRAAFREGAGLR